MKHILLILLTFSTLTFTTGCSVTPKYRVIIDAITADNVAVAPSSYEIKALDDKKNSNELVFQKHSSTLASILEQKGYVLPKEGQVAKQIIYLDYGIEKIKEETETHSEPDISMHMSWGYPYGGHHYSPFYYHDYYGGGYTTYQKTRVYYNRYVSLLAKDSSNKELWRVDVSSVGESKNLRKIIPKLLKATAPYLGINTPEPINLIIKDKPKKK